MLNVFFRYKSNKRCKYTKKKCPDLATGDSRAFLIRMTSCSVMLSKNSPDQRERGSGSLHEYKRHLQSAELSESIKNIRFVLFNSSEL